MEEKDKVWNEFEAVLPYRSRRVVFREKREPATVSWADSRERVETGPGLKASEGVVDKKTPSVSSLHVTIACPALVDLIVPEACPFESVTALGWEIVSSDLDEEMATVFPESLFVTPPTMFTRVEVTVASVLSAVTLDVDREQVELTVSTGPAEVDAEMVVEVNPDAEAVMVEDSAV